MSVMRHHQRLQLIHANAERSLNGGPGFGSGHFHFCECSAGLVDAAAVKVTSARVDGLRERHEHPRLRALGVLAMDEFELKAGGLDEFHRVSGEMATIGQTLFQWIKTTLPCLGLGVGGQAVFEEVETTTGLEDSSEFGECLFNARNGAERERAQRAVARIVSECHGFAMQARVLNGNRGGSDSRDCDLARG